LYIIVYCSPIYLLVFQVVSLPRVSPPKPCMGGDPCYKSRPSHRLRFGHSNNIWCEVYTKIQNRLDPQPRQRAKERKKQNSMVFVTWRCKQWMGPLALQARSQRNDLKITKGTDWGIGEDGCRLQNECGLIASAGGLDDCWIVVVIIIIIIIIIIVVVVVAAAAYPRWQQLTAHSDEWLVGTVYSVKANRYNWPTEPNKLSVDMTASRPQGISVIRQNIATQ
jgi:hypothetical protein